MIKKYVIFILKCSVATVLLATLIHFTMPYLVEFHTKELKDAAIAKIKETPLNNFMPQSKNKTEKILPPPGIKTSEVAKIASPSPLSEPNINNTTNYSGIVRTMILQKKWDDAIAKCQEGLAANPNDKELSELLKKASHKGLKWAVVKTEKTPVYDKTGKQIGYLSMPAILNVHEIKKVPNNTLAYCSKTNKEQTVTFFVKTSDLNIHDGNIALISQPLKELAVQQVTLEAKLKSLKKEASSKFNPANPYARAMEQAAAERKAYWTKVETLKKSFDSASGDKRMKIHDELRTLRAQNIRIEEQFEKTKHQYEEWEKEHPTLEQNDEIEKTEKKLQEVIDAISMEKLS